MDWDRFIPQITKHRAATLIKLKPKSKRVFWLLKKQAWKAFQMSLHRLSLKILIERLKSPKYDWKSCLWTMNTHKVTTWKKNIPNLWISYLNLGPRLFCFKKFSLQSTLSTETKKIWNWHPDKNSYPKIWILYSNLGLKLTYVEKFSIQYTASSETRYNKRK